MNANDARHLLDGMLSPLLTVVDFRRMSCLEYRRPMNDAVASLSWPCRLDARGFAAFTCAIGLRFEALSKWLDDGAGGEAPAVIGTPIHLLRDPARFAEWKFTNEADLQGLRSAIVSEVQSLAIPFIERCSRLTELKTAVESPDPKDWIRLGIDQDRQVTVLAAIQAAQGNKEDAVKTLNDALAERKGSAPSRTFDIQQMRKRLVH